MIKNVIFDIGNVLVDFRWRKIMENLTLDKEIQDEFEKSVFGSKWWEAYDHGTMSEEDVVAHLRQDNKDRIEAFELVWANRDQLVDSYDYSVTWIKELKAQGLKTFLLSNYPEPLFKLHEENGSFPFINEVDGKIVSAFVKMIKPNQDIYLKLLAEYHLHPEECVFIDDRLENVEGARSVGIQGIHFQDVEQAKVALQNIIKNS